MPAIKPRDVTFLELRDSMLCSECELISYNNTAQCLACGSRAVLSLARVLGGTLRNQQKVRMVAEEPLATVIEMPPRPAPPVVRAPMPLVAAMAAEASGVTAVHSAMKMVVERGYRLTRHGGAAIAAERRGHLICEARVGALAPSLGAEVRTGLSALSVRSRTTLRCDVASDDPRVDRDGCQALGVNAAVAAPITNLQRVLGVLTVVSPQPYAFDDRAVAVVQWLAGVMGVVFTSAGARSSVLAHSTTRGELGR